MEQRGRKHQKVKSGTLWFHYLLRSGVMQSLVVHVIVLLCLGLTFISADKKTTIKLDLVFDPVEEISIEPIEIPLPTPEPSEVDSQINSDVYVADSDVPIEIDFIDIKSTENPATDTPKIADLIEPVKDFAPVASKTEPVPSTPRVSSEPKLSSADRFKALMTSKLDDRLDKYGAQTGDVQISISWDDLNDIDLWVVFESLEYGGRGCMIGWSNKIGVNNGFLDIDMNVTPFTREAVENIFWPHGQAPPGRYTVYIHHYHQWDRTRNTTPVYVRIEVDGKVIYKKSNAKFGSDWIKVHTFTRRLKKR